MFLFNWVNAQRILISEPDRDDSRKMDFEIIGKMGNNYLIYKNIRNESFICLYDNDMKMVDKVKHEYLPDDRMIMLTSLLILIIFMLFINTREEILYTAQL